MTFEPESSVRFTLDPGSASQTWASGKAAIAAETDMSVFDALVKSLIDAGLAFVREAIPSLEHGELLVGYETANTLSGGHEVHVSGPVSFAGEEWATCPRQADQEGR